MSAEHDATWLITDATRFPDGARVDVRLRAGRVESVASAPRSTRASRTSATSHPGSGADQHLDARGGLLLPGLHDHHVHLFALAAARASVDLSPSSVRDAGGLDVALSAKRAAGEPAAARHEWVRGFGYHEQSAGSLDRARLDALMPDRPLRIQHASGKVWFLNSQALARLDLRSAPEGLERDATGAPTGRLFRGDHWLRAQLAPADVPDLAALSRMLAGFGITGITDTSAGNDGAQLQAFASAQKRGALLQSARVMGGDALGDASGNASGDSSGNAQAGLHFDAERVEDARNNLSRLVVGERKFLLDEDDLPPVDELVRAVQAARRQGRGTAWHCVSRVELLYVLHVLEQAGPSGTATRDRIEHAGVVPTPCLAALAARGLSVVTQPAFIAERGDRYRVEADPDDLPALYRLASLVRAGVPLGLSSDAPYGTSDPWSVMRAAVTRTTAAGAVMGPDEALSPEAALAGYLGSAADPGGKPREIRPGAPADLCLLHAPWTEVRERLKADVVRAVFSAGRLVVGG